jgi:putative endonuclease
MFYLYVLQSIQTGKYYIGSCKDLTARLKKHNSGNVKSTKPYKPWKIIYSQVYNTRAQAMNREKYLKSLKKRSALEKVIGPIV